LQHVAESVDARGASAQHDSVDSVGRGRRLEEVERLLYLEENVLGHRPEDGLGFLEGGAVDGNALLELFGRLVRQVELFLHRLCVGVATHRDVAREHRLLALQDVDVDGAGAGVQQDDDLARVQAVVGVVGVLQREGVDVDDDRRASRLRDDARVVRNLLFLGGDEKHFHVAARVRPGTGVEDLVVQVDVLDVERNVLFGFPVDRLVELRLGHDRESDLLDDHGVAGERGADVLRLEGAVVLEHVADGIGHRPRIDNRAVDDGVGGDRLGAVRHDPEALARRLQLDRLHGARSDVEPDDRLVLPKHAKHKDVSFSISNMRSGSRGATAMPRSRRCHPSADFGQTQRFGSTARRRSDALRADKTVFD
jgi:hypothetical protein